MLKSIDLFTSHEGLHLHYEEAMTYDKHRANHLRHAAGPKKDFYNLGAHFVWIGDRTRQLDHAHVEYFRGISNPIGVKVGPSLAASAVAARRSSQRARARTHMHARTHAAAHARTRTRTHGRPCRPNRRTSWRW